MRVPEGWRLAGLVLAASLGIHGCAGVVPKSSPLAMSSATRTAKAQRSYVYVNFQGIGTNPGAVKVYAVGSWKSPVRTIKPLRAPTSLALDYRNDLYVLVHSSHTGVNVYAPKATTPRLSISPQYMGNSKKMLVQGGSVFVTSQYDITQYSATSGALLQKYAGAAGTPPTDIAIDPFNILYCADTNFYTSIVEFQIPSNTPIRSFKTPRDPRLIAVDSTGTLYVTGYGHSITSYNSAIWAYDFGSTRVSRTITLPSGTGASVLFIDKSNNLYVARVGGSHRYILVYPPNATSPSRSLNVPAPWWVQSIAVERNGVVFAAVRNQNGHGTGVLWQYGGGSKSPVAVLNPSGSGPIIAK